MVQVLPSIPSFGTRLADVLTKAGGNIAQGYIQGQQRQKDQSIIQGFNPDQQSPLESLKLFSSLSPDTQSRLAPLMTQYIRSQGQTQGMQQKQQEAETAQLEKELEAEDLFKRLRENIKYTGSTNIPFTASFGADKPSAAWMRPGGAKAVQQREYFNTTARELEKYAREEYTKGTLSAQVFERLMETIPNADLSENQNIGRIKAFEDIILNTKRKVRAAAKKGVQSETKNRPSLEEIFK